MKRQATYAAALYCRLSRDDEGSGESLSIQSQRQILTRYANENGWAIVDTYIDDGYSGTNFERPNFQRMLSDIDAGKITMVITKDLSRLGRDYIRTGYYTDVYFAERDVRYIALNDGIDTLDNDNDIAPFKNILNEMYAKDISKKIRSSTRNMALNGRFRGTYAPFGYKKHPEDKHQLVVDERTAPIVRRMFELCMQGYGSARIKKLFYEEKVCTPSWYHNQDNPTYYAHTFAGVPEDKAYNWMLTTVLQILRSPVYKGTLVAQKQGTRSFKNRSKYIRPKDEWVVIENTHEAIVDAETWERVQVLIDKRRISAKMPRHHIFGGFLKCGGCGKRMEYQQYIDKRGKKHSTYRAYRCAYNAREGKAGYCSPHHIRYDDLYNAVLADIRECIRISLDDEQAILDKLAEVGKRQSDAQQASAKSELLAAQKRQIELTTIFAKLYEDNALGKLDAATYNRLSFKYQGELRDITSVIDGLTASMQTNQDITENVVKWRGAIEQYRNLSELNETILSDLVDRIIVHEAEVVGDERRQRIVIEYRFIGPLS